MSDDVRTLLRAADQLARLGRYAEANAIYERVAAQFLAQGSWLKAIAVAQQVVTIGDKYLAGPSKSALEILADAYAEGGLVSDSERVRDQLRKLP